MSRLAAALLVLALAVVPAAAQEDKHALAAEAVRTGFEPQLAGRIMASYWPAAVELIRQRFPEVSDVQLFQYESKTSDFADAAAEAAMAPMVAVLEKDFSVDELKALIAFYQSPAGRKLNAAAGDITAAMTGDVTARLGTEVKAFQTKVDAMLTADGH